jgi:hypothetical protein
VSWDIYAMGGLPTDIQNVRQMPSDFTAIPIGSRQEVVDKLIALLPGVDTSGPSVLVVNGPDFSIEICVGDDGPCEGLVFFVRGSEGAVPVISGILDAFGMRALDPQSETGFFEPGPKALESFRRWRKYRDQVVGNMSSE